MDTACARQTATIMFLPSLPLGQLVSEANAQSPSLLLSTGHSLHSNNNNNNTHNNRTIFYKVYCVVTIILHTQYNKYFLHIAYLHLEVTAVCKEGY